MTSRAVQRLRLTAVVLGLVFVVFAQRGGDTVADTKVDLVVDPLRFLGRALHLWDSVGNGGQMQNQAYGYLFPMGPFFAAAREIGLAPWVTQRAFESLVVVAAFLGVVRLTRLLGVRGFWPRVAAGVVYALCPRSMSELTSISSELMPVAALPWVLIPLVRGSRVGLPRQAAMRSGVALLFAGGVNAAATLAILPAPAIWLLTRRAGARKRQLVAWWALAVGLSCAWWVVPLVQLGRYSPPFLDWIETASTTTSVTSLQAALRGTTHWVAYLGPDVWPAGWLLAAAPLVIVATCIVAGMGLAGLAPRDTRHRTFLVPLLVIGLAFVTFGHEARIGPPDAAFARDLLDGPLVAFRNVHKFDPLVRLPLAVGFAHLLARIHLPTWWTWRGLVLPARAIGAGVVLAIGLVALTPAVTGQLASQPRITTEPGWWRQASTWLAAHAGDGRSLVVPGAPSFTYLWGNPGDNAIQPVATTPWAARNSIPLAPAGYIRLLDRIEQILAGGQADPTLAPLLRRSGISTVVLSNDLSATASQATSLSFVRATLDESPGLGLAAGFGPQVGGNDSPVDLIDLGLGDLRPAVQIYRVSSTAPLVDLTPIADTIRSNGSSDDLPTVSQGDPSGDPAVLFGADGLDPALNDLADTLTDGIRKRQAAFGGILGTSGTLAQRQAYSGDRAAYDYLPPRAGPLSAWRYSGITDVEASSSGSDLLAYLNRDPANTPWAALDADPTTAWRSASLGGGVGQWLQVRMPEARPSGVASLSFAATDGDWPTQVLLTTDAGFRYVTVQPGPLAQSLPLPDGAWRWLRVMVTKMSDGGPGVSVGVATLRLPGVEPGRTLVVGGATSARRIDFAVAPGYRPECLTVGGQPACDESFARGGEEDDDLARAFSLATGQDYAVGATVRLRPGAALDAALDAGSSVRVTASSTVSDDPRVRPGALVDADSETTWSAAPGDLQPTIDLRLPRQAVVRGLSLTVADAAPVADPLQVEVTAADQHWEGELPAGGRITFAQPVSTDTVRVVLERSSLRRTTSSQSFRSRLLPPGLSDIALDTTVPLQAPPSDDLSIGCTDGLALGMDGVVLPLQLRVPRSDALAGRAVTATACAGSEPTHLVAGGHQLSLPATALTRPVSVQLTAVPVADAPAAGVKPSGTVVVQQWKSTSRSVRVDTEQAVILRVRENFNSGWRATVAGQGLAAVQVDGWQQGFLVPAGLHGEVQLGYAPQRAFVIGLVGGLMAAGVLVLLAFTRRRRVDPLRGLVDDLPTPPYSDRPFRITIRLVATVAAFTVLAGWPGVVALATVALAGYLLRRVGWPSLIGWLAPVALLFGAIGVARAPAFLTFLTANGDQAQLSSLVALAAVIVGASSRRRPQRRP